MPKGSAADDKAKPENGAALPDVYDLWKAEWTDCRSTLARFDGYLDALRRQGFSYISALLTATGLISYVTGTIVTPWAKVAILAVTDGLIVVLAYLEKDYRQMEHGVATRARVLEGRLNFGESDTIAVFYRRQQLWKMDLSMSVGFILLTWLLGMAILVPPAGIPHTPIWPFLLLLATTAIALVAVGWASTLRRGGGIDFGVDQLIARVGAVLTFTATNLYHVDVQKDGTTVPLSLNFHLTCRRIPPVNLGSKDPSSDDPPKEVDLPDQRPLGSFDSVTWIWSTAAAAPGVYHWELTWQVPLDSKGRRIESEPPVRWLDVEIIGQPQPS